MALSGTNPYNPPMEAQAVQPRITVVVPTFNEAGNIEPLTRRVLAACPASEIVVVDDASGDGTAERARELGRTGPVRVIQRVGERGLSTAVLRGFAEARTDVCVVMDADLSHPPEAIPALVRAVEEGAEVAVGSRYIPGGAIDEWPLFRRLASKAGTLLARPLTPVHDPMAGFFCLRRSLLDGIDLKPRGFKILLEILARTGTRKIAEVPIRFEDRAAGESKFGPRERRDFLRQAWTLYRDLNSWPYRLAKSLATGATGTGVHLAVLSALVGRLGLRPLAAAACAFAVAMPWNYVLNRRWTFRAGGTPVLSTFPAYATGAAAGLLTQLGIMKSLPGLHYVLGASLGIAAGAVFTLLSSHLWAFRKR